MSLGTLQCTPPKFTNYATQYPPHNLLPPQNSALLPAPLIINKDPHVRCATSDKIQALDVSIAAPPRSVVTEGVHVGVAHL
jgi:hypothetical protein